ncbi:MAG: hypothetical protein WA895_17745, partial [Streptosporangiaceae bacterium]
MLMQGGRSCHCAGFPADAGERCCRSGRHHDPRGAQMLKVMAFLVKKQGLESDELIDYYETHHV